MKKRIVTVLIPFLALLAACTSVVLKPAIFTWPVESVLTVDGKGFIEEKRYNFSVSVRPMFYAETEDSSKTTGKEVRVIRDVYGYYYMVSPGFKNVYVFYVGEGSLKLENKLLIDEEKGCREPVFNQRDPNIELRDRGATYILTPDGIERK